MSSDEVKAYSGVLGAFPYAFKASDSLLFRSYVVLGGLVAILAILLFATSMISVVASTVGSSGSFSFSRAFLMLVALAVIGPILSPILLVARHHRLQGASGLYDRGLAWSGYVFVLTLYISLVISAPPDLRSTPPGPLAPIIDALYTLPPIAALVPPLVGAGLIYYVHNRFAGIGMVPEAQD